MEFLLLFDHILTLILNLYGDPNLPRSVVNTVIEFFDKFHREIYLPSLKRDILSALQNEKLSNQSIGNLDSLFHEHSLLFNKFNSENKRFNLLKTKGFREPEIVTIDNVLQPTLVDNEYLMKFEPINALWIPLRDTLKSFLEIPGMLANILNYLQKLSTERSELISNIVQGALWRREYWPKFGDDIVLPFYIYYDELECGNALGSSAGVNKFGAVYAQIACLPPAIASSLKAIFCCMLIHTEDKKKTHNSKVFKKIIEESNFLSTVGIEIYDGSIKRIIKFQLILVLGDNLGLNEICGFVQSFSADYYCRVCKCTAKEASRLTVEIESKLRNKVNYCADIELNKVSMTGIKENCVFHNVYNFHIVKNSSMDIMHDFMEGVCSYVLHAALCTFIFEKKYFSLQTLNNCIKNFDYGSFTTSNKPPQITITRLKSNLTLKMSAAETICLARYLPLIIGHYVEQDDQHWKLVKYLRRMLDILMSSCITKNHAKNLQHIVKRHNELYLKLYGDLKPKFHFITHYPRLLLELGPCINYSTMRFESRHRPVKAIIQSTSSKKNTLITIGIKQILNLCQTIHCAELENFSFSNAKEISKTDNISNNIKFFKKVVIYGKSYELGMYLITRISSTLKLFGQIVEIVRVNGNNYFTMEMYEEIYFHDHFHSYVVQRNRDEDVSVNQKALPNLEPVLSIIKDIAPLSSNREMIEHLMCLRYGL